MLRRTLAAGAVAAPLLAGTGTAFAQAVVIETPPTAYVVPAAPPTPYSFEYYAAPPPPVVRYYRYDVPPDEEIVVVRPPARVCGPGSYWTGDGCVYARW